MSTYPIRVLSQSFDHKGGTKSYHLMLIETNDGRGVFINRWGKKGQFGELQVTEGTAQKCSDAYTAKENAKMRGGYGVIGPSRSAEAAGPDDLARAIGLATFNRMGAKAVNHLDPLFDTSKMREVEPPRTNEDLRVVNDTTRRAEIDAADLERQRVERARAAEDERVHAYDNNELYGRF